MVITILIIVVMVIVMKNIAILGVKIISVKIVVRRSTGGSAIFVRGFFSVIGLSLIAFLTGLTSLTQFGKMAFLHL